MSIALFQRLKDLEIEVRANKAEAAKTIHMLLTRIEALEAKPKPGRPKNDDRRGTAGSG